MSSTGLNVTVVCRPLGEVRLQSWTSKEVLPECVVLIVLTVYMVIYLGEFAHIID